MNKIELYNDGIGFVEYVSHMGNDLTVVNSARVSFNKNKSEMDKKDKRLVKYLIKNQHTSTLEHCVVTFRIKVPLFVRSQHHRHRTWSYNEVSRRYTSEDLRFYEVASFRSQHMVNRQSSNDDSVNPVIYQDLSNSDDGIRASSVISAHHKNSLCIYNSLVKSGICREQARGVLPQNLYTEYYATCNLNNLIKFIKLRDHDHAQQEIRDLAIGMKKIGAGLWPTVFEDI